MTIAEILTIKFPEAFLLGQIRIVEDTSGTQKIEHWDAALGAKPTQATIKTWGKEIAQSRAFEALKNKRLEEEYKGAFIEVAGKQIRFPSEVKDETRLNSLMSIFEQQPDFIVENWKVAEGVYIDMTASLAAQVKGASFMHIAKTFSVEKAKRAEIDALETAQAINEWIDTKLNLGW